jgi:outer membrane lipoprotein carrier protein
MTMILNPIGTRRARPCIARRLTMAALLCWATPVAAQDATAALQRAESAYRRITTLLASFSQTIENPMLGGPERSEGTLFLEPPNHFAMRFTDPEGDRIVSDGTWLWLYAPSSVPDQVIRQPVPRGGMTTPNLMGQFAERPLERYEARYVGTDTIAGVAVDVVALRPRAEGLGFRSAEIAVASDGMFRRIAMVEESGQRRTLIFSGIRTGVAIPASEFRFDPGPNVRVVVP